MNTEAPPTNPQIIYTNPTLNNTQTNISEHENSWRSKFPKVLVIILSILQLLFTILIFILEIASLIVAAIYFVTGIVVSYSATGVGIWCAIPFLIAIILTIILVRKKGSRVWATRVLIAQLVLLVFTFVLIGITGNYVQTGYYTTSTSTASYFTGTTIFDIYQTKYQITQAQLAFGTRLMFSGLTYVGIYIYLTVVALWQPYHTLDTGHLFRK